MPAPGDNPHPEAATDSVGFESEASGGNGDSFLSPRQREILDLLGEGVHAREIAARLGLSEPTVRNHIQVLLRKLGCHSQLEAVAVARRSGLL